MLLTSIYWKSMEKKSWFSRIFSNMLIICIKWKEKNWMKIIVRTAFHFSNICTHAWKILQVSIFVYDGTLGNFCFLISSALSVCSTIAYSIRGQWINTLNYTKQNFCFVCVSQAIVSQFSWMMGQFSGEKNIRQPGLLAVCRQKSWLISQTCNFSTSWFGIT